MGATTTINDIEKAFLKRLIKQYRVQFESEKSPETKVIIISMIENLEKDLDRGTILVDQDESGDQQSFSVPPTERQTPQPIAEPPKEKKKVNPKVFEPTVVVATKPVVITPPLNNEKLDFLDDEEDGDEGTHHHHVENNNDNMESEQEEDDDYDSGGNVVEPSPQPTKHIPKRTSFIDKVIVNEQPPVPKSPVAIIHEEPPVEEEDSVKKRKRDPIPKICNNCNALQVGNHITITVCRGKCLYFEMIESKLITPKMIKEMDKKRAAHEKKFSAKGNDTTPQVEESGDEEKPKKKKKKRSLKKKQVATGGDDDGSN